MAAGHHVRKTRSLPRLPLEIYSIIATHLVPPEPSLAHTGPDSSNEWKVRYQTLRNLSLTCYALHRHLAHFFNKFVYIRSGHDIISLLVRLLRNSKLRRQVQHIYCDTVPSWSSDPAQERRIRESVTGKPLWERHYGKGMGLESVLAESEFMWCPGDVHPALEEETVGFGSGPAYDMDDILHLAFGGILLLVPNLETLSLHQEITPNGFMVDVKSVLEGAERTQMVLPKLRVVKLTENPKLVRTDSLPCFLSFLAHYERSQSIILSGVQENFQLLMKTLVEDHKQTMPQIEELVVRPWNTPASWQKAPSDSPLGDMMGSFQPFRHLPMLFNRLRVLEVEFDAEPKHVFDLWGPLRNLSSTLEVLRLTRQKFPFEALRGPGMVKLRELTLEDCSTFRTLPELDDVQHVLSHCTNGHYMNFEHRALERITVNGSSFGVVQAKKGPPTLLPLYT